MACDEESTIDSIQNKPQPQMPTPVRRGSHGNIMEAQINEPEKDSDDGGFLKRIGSKEKRLDTSVQQVDTINNDNKKDTKEESKLTEALQGSPRKRLEGEIGILNHFGINIMVFLHI